MIVRITVRTWPVEVTCSWLASNSADRLPKPLGHHSSEEASLLPRFEAKKAYMASRFLLHQPWWYSPIETLRASALPIAWKAGSDSSTARCPPANGKQLSSVVSSTCVALGARTWTRSGLSREYTAARGHVCSPSYSPPLHKGQ